MGTVQRQKVRERENKMERRHIGAGRQSERGLEGEKREGERPRGTRSRVMEERGQDRWYSV